MKQPEFYKEYPKTCARNDFWGQVKRTVNGKPVSQDQIDMIFNAVSSGLELSVNDRLLDLCCGNGALSKPLFAKCAGGMGVDYSEHLIGIAKEYFEQDPREKFILADVVNFLRNWDQVTLFTKAMCYGSFQYLSSAQAYDFLRLLRNRFSNVEKIYIGNLPDKSLLKEFYEQHEYKIGIEDDNCSMIGIWRTRDEFVDLAQKCGWSVNFSKMPENFYASHYRYDVILTPSIVRNL